MPQMPTSVQMEELFGALGVGAHTASLAKQVRDQEQRGRLVRDAQVQSNCRVDRWDTCTFTGESSGRLSEWIDFAHIHFTDKPAFSSGCQMVRQEGEDPISPDYSNYDSGAHFRVPALAAVACWRQDDQGHFIGCKLLYYALGSVPEGYQIMISSTFSGPAIRIGATANV